MDLNSEDEDCVGLGKGCIVLEEDRIGLEIGCVVLEEGFVFGGCLCYN